MKIAFVSGVNSSLDSSRGIGVATNSLIEEFKKLSKNNLEIVANPKDAVITHYLKFHPFFISLPFIKPSKKVILTIHDLIPLIYPDHYPSGIKGKIRFLINKFLIWKNVDAIITISETSKKDICRFLGVDPKKVHVVYLAPRKIFKKLKNPSYPNLPKKFVLYVGDINYNKNIPVLVRACEIAKMPLVIVGKHAKEVENMDLTHPELIHLQNINWQNVIRLGFIPDEDLVKVFNLASVFVQPSFYEGFGFGVVDAFACGTPVIASKTQALVEIAGDVAVFFDPKNPQDLANKIRLINKSLVKKGFERVKEFTWEKTAEETLEVYNNA
jgi:glycosyltransferase involved in cell wall biosynthesis